MASSKMSTTCWDRDCRRAKIEGMDATTDFRLDADFHRDLRHNLYDAGRSLDQKLELIAGFLNRPEPALLRRAAAWEDEEIARALLEFVNTAAEDQGTRPRAARLLNALVGAAEFERRADGAGLTALQYAHLIRVRRELGDA